MPKDIDRVDYELDLEEETAEEALMVAELACEFNARRYNGELPTFQEFFNMCPSDRCRSQFLTLVRMGPTPHYQSGQ